MPTEYEIEKLLFEQFEKPKNYFMTKVINVYDNRYRINVYIQFEEENLTKKKISNSFFCRYVDGELFCDSPKVCV